MLVVGLAVAAVVLIEVVKVGSISLPPLQPVQQVVHLDQGWQDGWDIGQKQWYHHASQGTKILNYDWFMALEQPELSLFRTPGLLGSSDYLQRFGFLASEVDESMNPDGLPIGFAKEDVFQEPYDDAPPPYKVVGLTCAACHTTQVNYQGNGIRIEGGPAMVDLGKFRSALGRSAFYTDLFPWRFERFAKRVLGDKADEASKAQLRKQLKAFIAAGRADAKYAKKKHLYDLESGFSRTDALGNILNRVFDDLNEENLGVADAPVNFPHIWDSSWLEWVQYNASIRTPMVRNIGEALGVGALINIRGQGDTKWRSTVNVENLHLMEEQLSGEEPFGGLTSPKWPEEILGKLNQELVQKGEQLYDANCSTCHWKVKDIQAARDNDGVGPSAVQMWTEPNEFGNRFINIVPVNLEVVGTDPAQALNFARRVVVTTPGREISLAAEMLDYTTSRVREVEYKRLGLFEKQNESRKLKFDVYRLPWEDFQRELVSQRTPDGGIDDRTNGKLYEDFANFKDANARLAYKARPLNGIWATAPYLHNGAVRNLYQLLSPVAERDKRFFLGSKQFDPVYVGLVNEKLRGGFEMNTDLSGNRNSGHEFRDTQADEGVWVKGVIGPFLTHQDRMALIEYLKSL